MEISHDDTWEQFLDEFLEIFSGDGFFKHKIFICGSYINENFANLKEIQNIINTNRNLLGFFENQFKRTHNENLVFKFDLLAKFSEEILIVIEHDKGGHMVEMGIIIAIEEFLKKTKVFVLKDAPITYMLKSGGLLSPFFSEEKNLYYFRNNDDLKSIVLKLYSMK
ncbi:MAG: hypothetical protein KAX10_04085 [Candidatus Lokiarchaeota archaeon]|nr:hypothetical protein [Candidatus Lokiarchaeota archaeon]